MASEVRMPKLGLTMKAGTISTWRVNDGDAVDAGAVLFVLETEKANVEIAAEKSGTAQLVVPEGAQVPIGTVIGYLLEPGEKRAEAESAAGPPPTLQDKVARERKTSTDPAGRTASGSHGASASPGARKLAASLDIDLAQITPTGPNGRIVERDVTSFADARVLGSASGDAKAPVSASARRLADELGVDLSEVVGSGPDGLITRDDVTAAADAGATPTAPEAGSDLRPMSTMRKVIARRMHASLHESAQLTISAEADADDLVELRRMMTAAAGEGEPAPGYLDLIIIAVSRALADHPHLNAHVHEDAIETFTQINIGFALSVPGGLVVPVVRDSANLGVRQLGAQVRDLAERGRLGALGVDEMTGSTFTVSSLATHRVRWFTPVINPPEVAILGIGRIYDTVEVKAGNVVPTRRLPLSLTIDHRAVDGDPGAAFLDTVVTLLETPFGLAR